MHEHVHGPRVLTIHPAPAPGVCRLIENGAPCPHVVETRGLCLKHYTWLLQRHEVERYGLPVIGIQAVRFAVKPEVLQRPGVCRLLANGVACALPALRRGLCARHYRAIAHRDDLDLTTFALPNAPIGRCTLRNDAPAGCCRALEDGQPCVNGVSGRGLCRRHYRWFERREPETFASLEPTNPRSIVYTLRPRPREGRCRVAEGGISCGEAAELRGLCKHHYNALYNYRRDLLEGIALGSAAPVAVRYARTPVPLPNTCVVVENEVACVEVPYRRGICQRHHRILGNHASYSLHDFYLPEVPIVLTLKSPEQLADGLCRVVDGDRMCERPPVTRGLCKRHYRLAGEQQALARLGAPLRSSSGAGRTGAGNDRPHVYLDKNVLFDWADHRTTGATGQRSSVDLVDLVRAGRVRATITADAVKATYNHVRYRAARPPNEGGGGKDESAAERLARETIAALCYRGGAWRIRSLEAATLAALVRDPPATLSLEDALEWAAYQAERAQKAGPRWFVTRDTDFPAGVHPAHLTRLVANETTTAVASAGLAS